MNDVQNQLLLLLSKALFGKKCEIEITEELQTEARMQSVSALVFDDYDMLANNIRVFAAHAELCKTLKGIPFVTFKGYSSAEYYPVPIKRSMGDVDFYVSEEFSSIAQKKLVESGFIESDKSHDRHRSFIKSGIIFELHNEIKGIPNGLDGIKTDSESAEYDTRAYLSDLIQTALSKQTKFGEIIIPDEFHHCLIMLLHVAGHIVNDGGIGLRHLCDWAVFVNKTDISEYHQQLKQIGLWKFACQLTTLSSKYLGSRKQYWAGEWSDQFLEQFMEDILAAGNFSQKALERRVAMKLEKQGWLSAFVQKTKSRYPVCEERQLLLPFYLLWNFIRLMILILRNKRNATVYFTGKERNALYEQFELFKTDV